MRDVVVTEEQWAGARALGEGATPTHVRIAACLGVHVTTVSHRASEEEWKGLDFRHMRVRAAHRDMVELARRAAAGEPLDPVAHARGEDAFGEGAVEEPEVLEPLDDVDPRKRLARIGDMLTRRTEAILRRAEAGKPLEARQVAALSSLVQLAERITTLTAEQQVEAAKKSDEELAVVLDKINNRIIYLAAHFARKILVDNGWSEEEALAALGPFAEEAMDPGPFAEEEVDG